MKFRNGRLASSRPSVLSPVPEASGELEVALDPGVRCAVAISHDVDHLGFREHLVDSFLVRYLAGLARGDLLRRFRPLRFVDRLAGPLLAAFGHDRWRTCEALLARERALDVRATWFVAQRRGLGIAYRREALRPLLAELRAAGCEIGLHGQSPDDAAGLAAEVEDLAADIGARPSGLRMHYLRLRPPVVEGALRAGLAYDSSVMIRDALDPATHALPAPRRLAGGLLEIPLHLMDSTLFSATGLGLGLEDAIDYTERLVARAKELRRVLVVNLHPNYYSRQDHETRDWFDALLTMVTEDPEVLVTDMRGIAARVSDAS